MRCSVELWLECGRVIVVFCVLTPYVIDSVDISKHVMILVMHWKVNNYHTLRDGHA